MDYKLLISIPILPTNYCATYLLTLEEIWDFVTNEFAISYDYLTFTTIVGYIYNYCLHLKTLATTLWLNYD
jgi:hypothetical protein